MIPFQERNKFRKVLYSKATILVFFVLVVMLARGAWNIHEKASIARSERDETAHTLLELQNRTTELQVSLSRLRSERGIEEEIRQKFTVAKLGEEVVVVVDDLPKKGENSETQGLGFWAKLTGFFK